ncbi:MAG: hypothetical protein JJU00_16240 [Opitutales bacterium]|nr:hypothetical protein [Opitutales bacterium]
MKTLLPASLLVLSLAAAAQAASTVYESPAEWFLTGDFNGNGQTDVIVAERATGIFRTGFGEASGGYTWLPFHPSGIAPVDDAAVGKIFALGFDTVAFTGRATNRVNLFALQSGSVPPPVSAFTAGIGAGFIASAADPEFPREPLMAVAVDGGAASPSEVESFLPTPPGFTPLWSMPLPPVTRALAPVAHERGAPRSAYWMTSEGDIPGSWRIHGVTLSNGEWQVAPPEGVPDNSRAAAGHFHAADDAASILVYQPGNSIVKVMTAETDGSLVFFLEIGEFDIGFPLGALQTLPDPDAQDLLLAVNADFDGAAVFGFGGPMEIKALENFLPPSGFITGVAPDGAGGFTLFRGGSPDGPSAAYAHHGFDGSDFNLLAEGTFPEWPSPERFPASIVLYEGEALVDDDARVRGRLFAGEWTRSAEALPGISAEAERFRSEALGLGDPESVSLGSPPADVDYALANQFLPHVSFASLGGPVGVGGAALEPEPLPGAFRTAISASFPKASPHVSGAPAVLYRTDASDAWSEYNGAFWLYKDTTLQWVTVDDGTRSAVHSGAYRFPAPPHEMDSDGDGVPDFVKIAAGLDPLGGTGAEGDGVSTLEALLGEGAVDPGSTFDVLVSARPIAGFENASSAPLDGTRHSAHTPSGSPLAFAESDEEDERIFPSVLLEELDIDRARPYYALATPRNFDIETAADSPRAGRELLALLPRPAIVRPEINYTYGGGSLAAEADAWINAARNAYDGHTRTLVETSLTPVATLHAALTEAAFSALLRARRGDPDESFTVFPFRSADAARTPVGRERLAELGRPDGDNLPYRPADVLADLRERLESADSGAAALRDLANDVQRVASLMGTEGLGRHAMPLEAFRYFLTHGDLPGNYLRSTELSGTQRQLAADTAAAWLGDLPARPFVSLALEITPDSVTALCTVLLDPATGTRHALLRATGERLRLPGNLSLSEGTVLEVAGYTDVSAPCGDAAIEVTRIALFSFPAPRAGDEDGNLLPDAWERFFLGTTGADPLASPDGSGFSALQQFLDGTDPTNPADIPGGDPIDFSPPSLRIVRDGGSLAIDWDWHEEYADAFRFRVAQSSDLASFAANAQEGTHTGNGRFEVTLPEPDTPGEPVFYRIEMSLR